MFDFRPTAAVTQFSSFSVAATSIVAAWLLLDGSTLSFAVVGRVNPCLVRFEVLTAVLMMVSWVMTLCPQSTFGGVAARLEGSGYWTLNVEVSAPSYFGPEDAGIKLSETLVVVSQSTRCHIQTTLSLSRPLKTQKKNC